jgi:hypothetical protein
MDSGQLSSILRKNRYTSNFFIGVFSSNTIPNPRSIRHTYPYCFVANTDRAGERGTHWVCFFIKNRNSIEYYDSYGGEPNLDIKNYLEHFLNVKRNLRKLQAIFETSCGPHVIYFIIERCRGRSFSSVLSSLHHPFSDTLVKMYIVNLFKNKNV